MSERELRQLIAQVVLEVLGEQHHRALVLFTGALLGFEDAADSLDRLTTAGWELDYVMTPSAKHVLDPERIARLGMREVSSNLVADHEILLVPTLTCNIAAKAAVGIGDCLASNVLHQFLLQHRPIVAARTAACPDSTAKKQWFPHIPAAYAAQLRANLEALERYGVALCGADELDRAAQQRLSRTRAEALPTPPRAVQGTVATSAAAGRIHTRVIGQAELARLPQGSTLEVPARAIVTDLARDLARANHITIVRNSAGGE